MLKPDSSYDLKRIDPERLLNDEKLDRFFLTLAVIYNDLKGLSHLQKDFYDNHPPPGTDISGYLGEYNGMTTQFYKMLAGFINEFLLFLEENEPIYQLPRFRILLSKLSKIRREEWDSIFEAALGRTTKDRESIGYKLMLIRNNVAYHYHQSDKVLAEAFKEFFQDRSKTGADYAYYARSNTMELTRFFYADAAVQRYLGKTATSGEGKSFEEGLSALNQLQKDTFDLLGNINTAIASILMAYISGKHAQSKK